MSKILLFFLNIIAFIPLNAQSFEYSRTWGTYIGPVGATSWTESATKTMLFDSQNNIHLTGTAIGYPNNYPSSYYDQFRVGNGGQGFKINPSIMNTTNTVIAKINPSGNVQAYEYYNYLLDNDGYKKKLKYIDHNNNYYYEYAAFINNLPIAPTQNTWLQNSNHPQLGTVLAKHSPNGTLLWATYLPVGNQTYIYGLLTNISIAEDESGNIYLAGSSDIKQNIATPGTFQDTYQLLYNQTTEILNGYIVKLNSNGEKIWGTYFPSQIYNLKYYNNSVYIVGGQEPTGNQYNIASANTFQSLPANFNLQKFNAENGTRLWGTYYGHSDGSSRISSIDVNETGVYVMGDAQSNTATQGYFGTQGTHQTTNAGSYDLFLSKFNYSGERIWSTYFGGTGLDQAYSCMQPLALNGNDIYITGWTYGLGNNLATPETYKSSPTLNTNLATNQFFVKFNSNGQRIWASYYGDSSLGYNLPINIAVNNSSLYLYGETLATTGYSTPNSWQPQIIDPNSQKKNVAFVAKFDLTNLSTFENNKSEKLILYNNPNNGNFSLKGNILEKETCTIKLYDMTGKFIHSQTLEKNKSQNIYLKEKLIRGTYMVQVNDSKNNNLANIKMIVKN